MARRQSQFHFFRAQKLFDSSRFSLLPARYAVRITGPGESREQRMRFKRFRLKFGMKLASQEERMIRKLDYLDVGPVGSRAANSQASGGQRGFVFTIEFVAVVMALADLGLSISPLRQRSVFEPAGPCAQPHGSTQLFHSTQLAKFVDH